MTEFEAKKVYLKDAQGDYVVPVAYSAKYSASGTDLDNIDLTVDQTYDATSTNAQSGVAVAEATSVAVAGKEDAVKAINTLSSSGTVRLTVNTINFIRPTGNVTFLLPTVADGTSLPGSNFYQILVQVNIQTVYSIDVGTILFFNETAPDLSTPGNYTLIFEYTRGPGSWACGVIPKGHAS